MHHASDRYRHVVRALAAASALVAACSRPSDPGDWNTSLTNTANVPPREPSTGGESASTTSRPADAEPENHGGACPASAPEPGSLCDVSRLPHPWCRYPARTCPGDELYRCTDGMWQPPQRECMGVGPLPPPEMHA